MSLKKKLSLAVLTTTLGATIVAAGSFALFTSTTSNDGNTFTAGTVTITPGDTVFTGAAFANLAPGDSGSQNLTVSNTGSLDAWVKVSGMTPKGALFDNGIANTDGITANDPLQVTADDVVLVKAHSTNTIAVDYSLPQDANDYYQGQTGTVDIALQAVQAKNNTVDAAGVAVLNENIEAQGAGPANWN